MKDHVRKWGIRCLWLLPIILALYLSVMGVDSGVVGNQVVEYPALMDDDGRNIVVGYLSRNPDDRGNFWLSLF